MLKLSLSSASAPVYLYWFSPGLYSIYTGASSEYDSWPAAYSTALGRCLSAHALAGGRVPVRGHGVPADVEDGLPTAENAAGLELGPPRWSCFRPLPWSRCSGKIAAASAIVTLASLHGPAVTSEPRRMPASRQPGSRIRTDRASWASGRRGVTSGSPERPALRPCSGIVQWQDASLWSWLSRFES